MKLLRLFTPKCPRCSNGDLFEGASGFTRSAFKMNKRCSNCQLDFVREPGFYTGAMYVSYGLDLIIGALLFGILFAVDIQISTLWFTALFSAVILMLLPWIYRTSRVVWLRLFG